MQAAHIVTMFAPSMVVRLPYLSNTAPVITLPRPLQTESTPTSVVAAVAAMPTEIARSFAMDITVFPTATRNTRRINAFRKAALLSIFTAV